MIAMAAVGVLVLWSCDVRDPIYDTVHPEHGKISLTVDWSQRGAGIEIPGSHTVRMGEHSASLTGTTNKIDHSFAPGDYTIYVHSPAANTAVSGTMATADYASDFPGWLFTGKEDVEVLKDVHHEFTVVMMQQVRQLTLVIEPTGGTTDRIETITGRLSGVAGGYDMASGVHSAACDVVLVFAKDTDGKWKATVRLLGVTGTEQLLTGTITFTGGSPGDMPLNSDLTAALATFNDNKKEPLTLTGQTVETQSPTGFATTINDWVAVSGGSVIAN